MYSRRFYFQNNKIKHTKNTDVVWIWNIPQQRVMFWRVDLVWSTILKTVDSLRKVWLDHCRGGGAFEGYTHPWLPFIQLFDCAVRSLPHILTTTNSWTEPLLPSLPQHELSPLANTSQRTPLPLLLFMQLFYQSNISRHTGRPLTPHPPASSLSFELSMCGDSHVPIIQLQ